MNRMNLLEIQDIFNKSYDFEKIKKQSFEMLEESMRLDQQSEDPHILPEGLVFSDYEVRFKNIRINMNDRFFRLPFFTVYIDLINPKTKKAEFYYDIDFNCDGSHRDEYFCRY